MLAPGEDRRALQDWISRSDIYQGRYFPNVRLNSLKKMDFD